MQDRLRKITAVASDLDGTILSSDQSLHPRIESVIRRIIDAVSPLETTEGDGDARALKHFFLTTSKSRRGAMDSLGENLAALFKEQKIPGIYVQGLYCVDGNGAVVF